MNRTGRRDQIRMRAEHARSGPRQESAALWPVATVGELLWLPTAAVGGRNAAWSGLRHAFPFFSFLFSPFFVPSIKHIIILSRVSLYATTDRRRGEEWSNYRLSDSWRAHVWRCRNNDISVSATCEALPAGIRATWRGTTCALSKLNVENIRIISTLYVPTEWLRGFFLFNNCPPRFWTNLWAVFYSLINRSMNIYGPFPKLYTPFPGSHALK